MSDQAVEIFQGPIGQLMLSFAMVDQALDFWLMEIFPHALKANVVSKMPFELGRKIEMLRKCFDRLPLYAQYKNDALNVLRVVEQYNSLRNVLAHGALSHYDEHPSPTIYFTRLKFDKNAGIHVMHDEVVTLSGLMTANNATIDAVAVMHTIANKLHGNI